MTHNLSNSYKIKIRGSEGKTLDATVPNQTAPTKNPLKTQLKSKKVTNKSTGKVT